MAVVGWVVVGLPVIGLPVGLAVVGEVLADFEATLPGTIEKLE